MKEGSILIDDTVNKLSLVMTIQEDIVKACKQNDLSPAFVETLLRLHNQQLETEKAINSINSALFALTQLTATQTDIQLALGKTLKGLFKHVGYKPEEMVSTKDVGQMQ